MRTPLPSALLGSVAGAPAGGVPAVPGRLGATRIGGDEERRDGRRRARRYGWGVVCKLSVVDVVTSASRCKLRAAAF